MTRPRRAFGQIRRLVSGRWQARYFREGKYVNGAATFATKTAARQWLETEEQKINAGTWVDPAGGRTTLAAFASAWLDRKNKTGWATRTAEFTRWLLGKYVLPQLGNRELSEVTTARVRQWHADLVAERGQGQAGKAYRALRAMMNEAVADGLIPASPCVIKGAAKQPDSDRPTVKRQQVAGIAGQLGAGRSSVPSGRPPKPSSAPAARWSFAPRAAAESASLERRPVATASRFGTRLRSIGRRVRRQPGHTSSPTVAALSWPTWG